MKNLFKYLSVIFLFASFFSCEKELAISEGGFYGEEFIADGDIVSMYVSPGADLSNFGSYIDAATGKVFITDSIVNNYHHADLAFLYGSTTLNNIVTMDARNISFNNIGEDIEHVLPYKNKGELYVLSNTTELDKEWFNNIKTSADIQRGYDSLLTVIALENGSPLLPSKRLTNVKKGSIVLFRSISRDFKSIIYVENVAINAQGRMNLRVKSDCRTQKTFRFPNLALKNPLLRVDTMVISSSFASTDENFIDLKNRKSYKDYQLLATNNDLSSIQLVHTYNGTQTTFYTPQSIWIANSGYSTTLSAWLSSFPNTQLIHFLDLTTNAIYTGGIKFEGARNNNQDLKDYLSIFGTNNSHTTRIIDVQVGRIFRVRNTTPTENEWGMVKVLAVNNTTGTCTIAYKYYNNDQG